MELREGFWGTNESRAVSLGIGNKLARARTEGMSSLPIEVSL